MVLKKLAYNKQENTDSKYNLLLNYTGIKAGVLLNCFCRADWLNRSEQLTVLDLLTA